MPAARTGGIDDEAICHPGFIDQVRKNTFCKWGAAYISHANK
jgi:hypothetical protein